MTMTTEPTTIPEVPAWLNLDGYLPAELRARLASAREHLADLMPQISGLGWELATVMLDVGNYHAKIGIEFDDHQVAFDPWTGLDSLREEVVAACDDLLASQRETIRATPPDWYLVMAEGRAKRAEVVLS